MADQGGDESGSVKSPFDLGRELSGRPEGWSFFAAVRAAQALRGDMRPVGEALSIDEDMVRFEQPPSLGFEPQEVASFTARDAKDGGWRMRQNVFGLFGPNGPLPLHITEQAMRGAGGEVRRDTLMADFCNMIQHRMTSLLYRAWSASNLAASRDLGTRNPFHRYIDAQFGAAPSGFQNREPLSDDLKRHMAGLLAGGRRSAQALSAATEILTGAKVRVIEFAGEWLRIPADRRSRLTLSGEMESGPPLASGEAAALGCNVVLGAQGYSLESRVVLEIGPLDYSAYRALLPGEAGHKALQALSRHVLGLVVLCEARPILKRGCAPALRLGAGGPRLGWEAWFPGGQNGDDLKDARLRL